jgi:hypothetical protein
MQDNGVLVGPSNYKFSSIGSKMEVSYENLMGGDGMQIQIDKRNPNIVFTFSLEIIIESIVPQTNASTFRQSRKDEKPFRFNWQTPILLSSHNQDILYMGSNLHRSMNQGQTELFHLI